MENRDYREEIGKKLEEALELGDFSELEDLIEMPSPETFAKWTELGVEKHNKRVRRKRTLAACAIFVVVCVSALIAIKCIAPPEVEAGPDGKIDIDITDMESTTTYDSWNDLPSDIKDQFIEIKDLPDGYEVEKVVVAEGKNVIKLKTYIANNEVEAYIRQSLMLDGTLPKVEVTEGNEKHIMLNKEVYVEKRKDINIITYKYTKKNIVIDIVFSNNMQQEQIEKIMEAF